MKVPLILTVLYLLCYVLIESKSKKKEKEKKDKNKKKQKKSNLTTFPVIENKILELNKNYLDIFKNSKNGRFLLLT